jgi:glucose dehydrogenase
MTMAPLIVNGKVMIGVSGGEFGVRGFVQAFDAESGDEVWKTYTIPGEGEPGNDTWEGDTWKRGGASVWMTGNYDAEANMTYWGTGNASPWFGDQRPGDNLYTSSTLAIDPDTGELKGHFQYHWNDSWDWDEMNAPMVVNYKKDGNDVQGLIKPSRNGYLYWLSRSADGIGFVDAKPYVKQTVFTAIDPETGRPSYDESHKPGTGKKATSVLLCGVAKTGRSRRTILTPAWFSSLPTITIAVSWKAKSRNTWPASGGPGWIFRTLVSWSKKTHLTLAMFRPGTSIPARKPGVISLSVR